MIIFFIKIFFFIIHFFNSLINTFKSVINVCSFSLAYFVATTNVLHIGKIHFFLKQIKICNKNETEQKIVGK